MGFIQSNISREVGGHPRGWSGAFWHQRYEATPILDDTAAVARLRYLLENSVKENLVETIEDWPGANSAKAMLTGLPDVGLWIDRTAESAAGRAGREVDPGLFAEEVEVPLVPLPTWAHLPRDERANQVRLMLDDIRDEHAARRARSKVTVLGVEKVLAEDPFEQDPSELQRKKAKKYDPEQIVECHASSKALRDHYHELFVALVEAHRVASAALRYDGDFDVEFPEGTFRPDGVFTEWVDESASNALE